MVARRARHIITDLHHISRLMATSHASMRDDAGGVRMTGGGFGGCVVALLPFDRIAPVDAAVNAQYPAASGLSASIYVCRASAGAGVCE